MESLYRKDYQAIFFDLDGTLYHEKKFKFLFILLHPFYALEAKKLGDLRNQVRSIQKLNFSNYDYIDLNIKKGTRLKIQREIWPAILSRVGYFKGVDSVLKFYKSKGIFLAVVSDDAPEEKLKGLGLREYFDFVVDLNDHGCLKPSPEYLRCLLKEKNFDSNHCLFVGDKEKLDGKLASTLNMHFLCMPDFKKWSRVLE